MSDWTVDQIKFFLTLAPFAARVRMSGSKALAQIDIYHSAGNYPSDAIADLEANGWTFGGAHEGLPDDVSGYYYEHQDVSQRRLKDTRAILNEYFLPTNDIPAPDPEPVAVEAPPPPEPPRAEVVAPAVLTTEPPAYIVQGTYRVIEVLPTQNTSTIVGRFWEQRDAFGCAYGAPEGAFRLIYNRYGIFVGGKSWRPIGNDEWQRAKQIAEGRYPAIASAD